MHFTFGSPAKPAKFSGKSEMSSAVSRKQAARFGIGLGGPSMIPLSGLYAAQAVPPLCVIGVLSYNVLVHSTPLVPLCGRYRAFAEMQLRNQVVGPDSKRRLK
jgi:hypothetical protein